MNVLNRLVAFVISNALDTNALLLSGNGLKAFRLMPLG